MSENMFMYSYIIKAAEKEDYSSCAKILKREVVERIATAIAIAFSCFCFHVAKTEHGSLDNPGPYNITLVNAFSNGKKFKA